jgi:hypothetical protein
LRFTNISCRYCGKRLLDIGGFGEGQKLICNNVSCESHYLHILCPNELCRSNRKFVRVLGLGHKLFRCKKCGTQWNSLQ